MRKSALAKLLQRLANVCCHDAADAARPPAGIPVAPSASKMGQAAIGHALAEPEMLINEYLSDIVVLGTNTSHISPRHFDGVSVQASLESHTSSSNSIEFVYGEVLQSAE